MTMTDIEAGHYKGNAEGRSTVARIPLYPELTQTEIIAFDPAESSHDAEHPSFPPEALGDESVEATPYNQRKAVDTIMGHLAVRDPADVDQDVQRWIVDIRGQIERQDIALPSGMTINQYIANIIREMVPEGVRESVLLAFEERRKRGSDDNRLMEMGREVTGARTRAEVAERANRKLTVEKAKERAKLEHIAALVEDDPELHAKVRAIIDSRFVDPRHYVDPFPDASESEQDRTGIVHFLLSTTGALAKAVLRRPKQKKAS